jgi:ABC-type uncharacterized transport system
LLAACNQTADLPKTPVTVMTALPLFWGEGGPRDILHGADQRALIIRRLSERHQLHPIDVIDAKSLSRAPLLLLAQPRELSGDELVTLDKWVNTGGKAVVFADPLLSWPSIVPMGDRRRAPMISLLDPLLAHWGLTLTQRSNIDARIEQRIVGDRSVAVVSPGVLAVSNALCRVTDDQFVADCSIGTGRVIVIADADLLDERLWTESGIANDQAIFAVISRIGTVSN